MPSHSVPDSSVYVPSHHLASHPGAQRTTYEGKGLLSLVLTEPAPGRTIVRGRMVRSAAFGHVVDARGGAGDAGAAAGADLGDDDDGEGDDVGGGLEALVRAANKRKAREEAGADPDERWGLEVEILLKALPGWPAERVPLPLGAGPAPGGRAERSSSVFPLTSIAPHPRRRSRIDEPSEGTSWRPMPTSAADDDQGGDGDDDGGMELVPHSARSSAHLPLPPAYRDRQSSTAPLQPKRSASVLRQSLPPALSITAITRTGLTQPARHPVHIAPRPRQLDAAQFAHARPSMPMSDPIVGSAPTPGVGRGGAGATLRATSVEPMVHQNGSRMVQTAGGGQSRAGTPRAQAPAAPPAQLDATARVPPDPMQIARGLLKAGHPTSTELAQKLVGKDAVKVLLAEMSAEAEGLAGPSTAANGSAAQSGLPATEAEPPAPVYRCDNCHTTETSMWRVKMLAGGKEKRVCNDCGLYFNDHKRMRPKHLWGLTGDAALGKGGPPSSNQKKEKERLPARPLPRTRSSHDGTEKGSSANPLPVPDSPLRNKRVTLDAYASPRRSTRLKTGQTPAGKSSPTHRGLSNEFSEMDDSPSKHLRATPRRQAQARNMELDMNTHAPKWKLGDKSNAANGHSQASGSRASGSLAASPFASAASGQQASTSAPGLNNSLDKSADYSQHILGMLDGHPADDSGITVDMAFLASLGVSTKDEHIEELLQMMASSHDPNLGGTNALSQADIEGFARGFENQAAESSTTASNQQGDTAWDLSTSPWAMIDGKDAATG